MAVKNPNLEVIGEYTTAKNKITHHCLRHDIYLDMNPFDALKGSGCELCRREKLRNCHQKTTEQYIEELHKINPFVVLREPYIDSHTPILHECTIHGVEWKTSPTSALQGCGCYKCKSDKIRNRLSKTHEQYVDELRKMNANIEPVEQYMGANIPILHRCLIDGYEWYATPNNILNGGFGCPKCSKRFRRTHTDYVNEVSAINPDIEVLGMFVGLQVPTLHRCKVHNIEWMAYPEFILKGCGCRECGNDKARDKNSKTHEQYVLELQLVNPDIIVVDTYINSFTPILHKCLIDGCEWYASPLNTLNGRGCPQCNESQGERCIRQWLTKRSIKYIYQHKFNDCKDKKCLPFDFYLPDYNRCIEYDGKQHFEPIEWFGGQKSFEYTQKHDKIKNEYCENNNINLIRIPYYTNVEEELNNFLFI